MTDSFQYNWKGFAMISKGENEVGRFTIEFQVANRGDVIKAKDGLLAEDKVRRMTVRGMVDSGAGRLVLPNGQKRCQEPFFPAKKGS